MECLGQCRRQCDCGSGVPLFGTPGLGPNSHFYTADPSECALVKQNPKWTYEAIAFYIDVPQGIACKPGTTAVYRSFYPGADVSASNHRFLTDLTMHEKMAFSSILEGVGMCAALSSAQVQADAVRLLEQSTFGATDSLVDHVTSVGIQGFLSEQFATPASQYPPIKYVPAGQQATFCPTDPDPTCGRDYYTCSCCKTPSSRTPFPRPDQLRQRVAFALSQILVTSGLDINLAYGMEKYQQIFLDNAFGNYEDVLTKVTLSSVMGDYLNMVKSNR